MDFLNAIFGLLYIKLVRNYLKPILFASFFILFFQTLAVKAEFGYYIGAVVIMTIISGFCFKNYVIKKDIKNALAIIIIGLCFLVVVGLVADVTVLNYKSHWTPNFDFGIFSQMFYYMKETFLPLTTCERDGLLSHFAVHFSAIYYVVLPIYSIFPTPITLLILQGIISASGVIPVWLIAKKYKHSNLATMLLSICYLTIPAIVGGNLYYFHENVFLAPLLLWLFYFTDKEKYLPATVFAFFVLIVKEDAAMYIIFFGIYLLFSKKNIKFGSFLTATAIVYFLIVTNLMQIYGQGVMFGRFDNYSTNGEPVTIIGVFLAIFRNPGYFLSTCFNLKKVEFLLKLFMPVMFIPFITRKYSRFILLAPVVLINLMSDYIYQYDMNFQYVFGSAAFVIYLTIINSADLNKYKAQRFLITSSTAGVLLFSTLYWGRLGIIDSYKNNMYEHETIANSLALIPDDASVASSTFFVPNLSQRDVIYELETTSHQAEYYVLDLRYSTDEYSVDDYKNENYQAISENEFVAIYRRVKSLS